ncbi:MAG: acyltransferase [Gammaproteobacteria bacterium]|nr:MAG: acyltransferase [Gammaproteobacteria bacterium]
MKRLELLDYGRFLAALFVIAYHYLFNGIANGKVSSVTHFSGVVDVAKYGYLGVEFFFMISGYVIFFTANNKSAGQFLTSRAIRLFPAFWAAVIFTSCVAYFWGGDKMSVSLLQSIANLSMFPGIFGYSFVDGVYWTLAYEWKFYLLVFVILVLGFQSKLRLFFTLWPFGILLAGLITDYKLPYLSNYYSYFAAGALFAMRKDNKTIASLISLSICLYLCIKFSLGQIVLHSTPDVEYSKIVVASLIILLFLFFIFLNSNAGSSLKLSGSKLAGGLTYPIYLVHAHFGYMVLSKFANDENKIQIYCITLITVLVVAYFIHTLIEQGLAKVWKPLFSQSIGRFGDFFQQKVSSIYTLLIAARSKNRTEPY